LNDEITTGREIAFSAQNFNRIWEATNGFGADFLPWECFPRRPTEFDETIRIVRHVGRFLLSEQSRTCGAESHCVLVFGCWRISRRILSPKIKGNDDLKPIWKTKKPG